LAKIGMKPEEKKEGEDAPKKEIELDEIDKRWEI
jgi:hypothetical protein